MNTASETKPKRCSRTLQDPVLAAVKVEMVKHGLTIGMLAERIGYAKGTVKNVLQGRSVPGVRAKIEEFFGRQFWS